MFNRVTATSATVAPVESVTRPATVPVMFWANAVVASDRATINTHKVFIFTVLSLYTGASSPHGILLKKYDFVNKNN